MSFTLGRYRSGCSYNVSELESRDWSIENDFIYADASSLYELEDFASLVANHHYFPFGSLSTYVSFNKIYFVQAFLRKKDEN